MVTDNELKIEEYEQKINEINEKYENRENKLEHITRGSLLVYSVGAVLTPCTLVTNHPHLAMISAGAAILSISAFSLSLGVVVSTGKKVDKLKEKVKMLKKETQY